MKEYLTEVATRDKPDIYKLLNAHNPKHAAEQALKEKVKEILIMDYVWKHGVLRASCKNPNRVKFSHI